MVYTLFLLADRYGNSTEYYIRRYIHVCDGENEGQRRYLGGNYAVAVFFLIV